MYISNLQLFCFIFFIVLCLRTSLHKVNNNYMETVVVVSTHIFCHIVFLKNAAFLKEIFKLFESLQIYALVFYCSVKPIIIVYSFLIA